MKKVATFVKQSELEKHAKQLLILIFRLTPKHNTPAFVLFALLDSLIIKHSFTFAMILLSCLN